MERDCKNCGEPFKQYLSTQNLCPDCQYEKAKQKPIKRTRLSASKKGKLTSQWFDIDRPKWIKTHPPNHQGYWQCYLQIAPNCRHWVNESTISPDHVIPRSRDQSKRSKMQNIKPACRPCNYLKGSRTIAVLKKEYPNSLLNRASM